MNISEKLEDFLIQKGACYELFTHPVAYSSQRTAQAEHVPGKEEAKVVIMNADGKDIMAVLPAPYHVDLLKLAAILGVTKLRLETERKFRDLFPDSEPGAMSPFGNLYNMPVYVDEALAKNEEIVFNAGSHNQAIKMRYLDYERLAEPKKSSFAMKRNWE